MKKEKRDAAHCNTVMEGATIADWGWLANFDELRRNVYINDHVSKSARHPEDGELPWECVWALARRNKKFIHCDKMLPSIARVQANLSNFCNKLHWKWHFRNKEAKPSILCKKDRAVPSYDKILPPELKAWTKCVHSELTRAAVKARSRFAADMLPAEKNGIRLLEV